MLQLLDESLAAYLRAVVPLGTREVDVVFEAPDRDWAARVNRPTINLYLWDVRRSAAEGEIGMVTIPTENGRPRRQGPLPRIDCRYLVTAWTTDVGDEHSLLGRVLAALLLHTELDVEYLSGALKLITPIPTISLHDGQEGDNSDFWSALGGQLKPGLDVVITASIDAAVFAEAGPPVETVTLDERTMDGVEITRVQVAPDPEPGR